jgi:hypothetical protein
VAAVARMRCSARTSSALNPVFCAITPIRR